MNTSRTGTIIREHRTVKNMTQKELADKLGVTTFAVSKWENGKSLPDISLLEPISSILDISLDELITGRQPHDSIAENETVKELIAQAEAETKKKVTQRTWHTILIVFTVMVISAQLLHLILISIVDFVPYNLEGSSLTARDESFPLPMYLPVKCMAKYLSNTMVHRCPYLSCLILLKAVRWRMNSLFSMPPADGIKP